MVWHTLSNIDQLKEIELFSEKETVILFKHSTRCSISSMAKSRLEAIQSLNLDIYYLDLIAHRDVSNFIAEKYQVEHQSPQIIVLKNRQAIGDLSHNAISRSNIEEVIS